MSRKVLTNRRSKLLIEIIIVGEKVHTEHFCHHMKSEEPGSTSVKYSEEHSRSLNDPSILFYQGGIMP